MSLQAQNIEVRRKPKFENIKTLKFSGLCLRLEMFLTPDMFSLELALPSKYLD